MDIQSLLGGIPFRTIPFSAIKNDLRRCHARSRLPERAQSVLVALFPYYLGEDAYKGANVSRYAVSADYHTVLMTRLESACAGLRKSFPGEEFAAFADNSPLPEKHAAALAGLGVIGKNSLLIHKEYGSYCFIGTIVTSADLGGAVTEVAHCRGCGNCIAACPSGALRENGADYDLCLSAVTQKKGDLTASEQSLIKKTGCIWGCDLCQTACPMNRGVKTTPVPEFIRTAKPVYETGGSLEARAYAWRGRAVIERNLAIINGDTE